jgi:hypothetical protein
MLGLFFDPENGSDTVLRNVEGLVPHDIKSQNSSWTISSKNIANNLVTLYA